MRTVWRGALRFGMTTMTVRLVSASTEHRSRVHLVHREDSGRVRHQQVCGECSLRLTPDDIGRGYELEDGRIVQIDPRDLPAPEDGVIDVQQFAPVSDLDPIALHRSYYVEPDDLSVRSYVLLRETLERTKTAAIVKFGLRGKETLAAIRAQHGVLVLHTLLWPDEVREPHFAFLHRDTEVRTGELAAAAALVRAQTRPFRPHDYPNTHHEALLSLVEANV
ncbi:non-homologous end joining protein Ku [Lentzea terrae]|uniref:non-homologous end joining protein Ku n=1 Tax=Lentzea terrae TaxID=2200761 RepID=UPI0013006353|nr:Ku protein [Lentzea terrae]